MNNTRVPPSSAHVHGYEFRPNPHKLPYKHLPAGLEVFLQHIIFVVGCITFTPHAFHDSYWPEKLGSPGNLTLHPSSTA